MIDPGEYREAFRFDDLDKMVHEVADGVSAAQGDQPIADEICHECHAPLFTGVAHLTEKNAGCSHGCGCRIFFR
jgi:hypothetical protein